MKERIISFFEDELWKAWVKDNRKLLIKVGAVAAAIVLAFFVFVLKGNAEEPIELESSDSALDTVSEAAQEKTAGGDQTTVQSGQGKLVVDVGGAVVTPMVVELPEGSRIADAIEAAGGLTSEADIDSLNRAAFISDGEKVYVPKRGEISSGGADSAGTYGNSTVNQGGGLAQSGSGTSKININTADASQLQELTGVGPVTAEKIIRYRSENGRFSTIEELKNVSGIGEKTFEKLQDDICV